MVNFFVIPYLKPPKQEEDTTTLELSADEAIQPVLRGEYSLTQIATNESNGDLLYAVEGDIDTFFLDHPEAIAYYEADWFQNYYPDAPGVNPMEKYYNAIDNVTIPNPPIWSELMGAIAASPIFDKLLTTQDPNAFSALQSAINYRNMGLFKSLANRVLGAIPGGLTEEDVEEFNKILRSKNFPELEELTDQ